MKKVLVVVGPTAVGKTKIAIELAKHYNFEVISGDSVAVYKRLDIGSAKPTKEGANYGRPGTKYETLAEQRMMNHTF